MLKRFGLGFAIGYVMGARAGEKRYEQLTSAGQKLVELPAIRDLVDKAPDSAAEAGRRLISVVRERASFLDAHADGHGSGADREDEDDEEDDPANEAEPEDFDAPDESAETDEQYEDSADDEMDEDEGVEDRQADEMDEDEDRYDDGEDEQPAASHRSVASSLADLASAAFERGRVA